MTSGFVPLAFVAAVDVIPHRLFHVWPIPIPREDFQCLGVSPVSSDLRIVILFEDVKSDIPFIWNVQAALVPQEFVVQ